jgi:hypothetical protein
MHASADLQGRIHRYINLLVFRKGRHQLTLLSPCCVKHCRNFLYQIGPPQQDLVLDAPHRASSKAAAAPAAGGAFIAEQAGEPIGLHYTATQ